MRRIGIAGLVGGFTMAFLSYVPVMGWLNLLLGLWFFVGGLVAAATWTRMGDGSRGVMPCIAAAGLGGILLAAGTGLHILVRVEQVALEVGQAELLREYPSGDLTTPEVLDYWDGVRISAGAALEAELAKLEAEEKGKTAAAYRLRQNLSKLEEMKVKMGRLRTDHAREVSSDGPGVVEWMAQTSHGLIQSLRAGDASMVRWPFLVFVLIRGLFIVGVAIGGGILGALVFGTDPEELATPTPTPAQEPAA